MKRSCSMEDGMYILTEDIDIIEYSEDLTKHFTDMPDVARPLIIGAKETLSKIEQILYSAPSFFNMIKSSVPKQVFQAVLTDEQKSKLASGALKIMTKKDGSLMANLINPKTKRVVSTISLKNVNVSPEFSQAVTSYATQMQLAQIAEQMQLVQSAIEEVRQGQEYDRLATAYSCQQKLLQAIMIKNPELKAMALLRIASDAEDSRNLLMQSQNANLSFIKEQPESFWGKVFSGSTPEKISSRINEIRDSLCAVNMVSFVEAMAYQELGEPEVACQSLKYYSEYIQKAYLDNKGFVERLDLIDSSSLNYWSETLPDIKMKIEALPYIDKIEFLGGGYDNE